MSKGRAWKLSIPTQNYVTFIDVEVALHIPLILQIEKAKKKIISSLGLLNWRRFRKILVLMLATSAVIPGRWTEVVVCSTPMSQKSRLRSTNKTNNFSPTMMTKYLDRKGSNNASLYVYQLRKKKWEALVVIIYNNHLKDK